MKALWKPLGLLWAVLTLALPALMVFSALRTYRSLEDQKTVYLRSRAAAIAARLEHLPEGLSAGDISATFDDEPGLAEVAVLEPPADPEKDALASLWLGRELFRTAVSGGLFRAWVPFHGPSGVRLARIDLAESSADFLVEHARHQLWIVSFGALAFIALSILAAWSVRRRVASERRQLELQYLAQIGEMSAVLAHEIRNPLGTIKGFAQLLAERLPPADRELTAPIISEAVRLEGLVKDLLLYGRPAAPVIRPVETRRVAASILAHAGALRGTNDFQSDVADVTFHTDANLLEQALLNLVKNAFEALDGRPHGTVRLEAEAVGGKMVWRVLDDGPGLAAGAGTPFRTTKAFGTGLGLPVTRKLVEALGGEFTIVSRAAGGTEACISLPMNME